jgi:ElaB/YqjD/DUF883 family membrane-anchored ribosome-binding protein
MNAAVVELFDGVDDLIRRVAHTECPETRKVRARVHAALVAARDAFDSGVKTGPSQLLPVAPDDDTQTFDETATQTLGVALLLGLGLGLMVDSR